MKVLLTFAAVAAVSASEAPAFDPKLSAHINRIKPGWTAATEPHALFANRTLKEASKLLGVRVGGPRLPRRTYPTDTVIPDSFDSATRWPNCPTIQHIRDQSACGSCWAFGAAESISDRYCTVLGDANPAARNITISANDILSCCDGCGNGCDGGFPSAAWQFWIDNGLKEATCEPYPFPVCEHHMSSPLHPPCATRIYPTPSCPTTCADGSPISSARTFKGSSSWSLSGELDFQQELLAHGPFEITMTVYQDFEQYKGGIYRHVSGPMMGGHAVRLVGWGTENGTPYWKVANSWNPTWGENGYFRILRGSDECSIEDDGTAGLPASIDM